jgi:hypothetical protein
MIRYLTLLTGLCGLALGMGLMAVAVHGQIDPGPVYTVAQVQAHLERAPTAWLGRTVRVRGWVDGCPGSSTADVLPECWGRTLYYLTDATAPATEPLVVVKGDRGPLLGALLSAPQTLHWGADASYRVQLQPAPAAGCYPTPPCYAALLLDAAPGAG